MPRFASPLSAVALVALTVSFGTAADDTDLKKARGLLLRGRYAEAIEAAKQLAEAEPTEAILLQAEALEATGQASKAHQLLSGRLKADPNNAKLRAAVALAWGRRGNYDDAYAHLTLPPGKENDTVVAHWLKAKALLQQRKYAEARDAWRWFAEQEASPQFTSVDEALLLADGLVEHARWSREAKWFNVAVNDVLTAAEQEYPLDWRIPYQRAKLFAEKHNDPATVDSLNAALAKNSSAAELHALRARLAVERFDLDAARRSIAQARRLNPALREIPLLEADIAIAELQPALATTILHKAMGESVDGPDVRGRLEAVKKKEPAEGIGLALYSGPGPHVEEYLAAGDAFDRMRRFSQAAEFYRKALQLVPDYPGIRSKLAQQLLRLGEEEEGTKLLAEAAHEDPFDVRVKNSIEVMEVLGTYATLETEHFILRFDRGQDELLAKYAAEYLEQDVYPDLVKRFGYAPRDKSLIEIYNRSRNTSGHGWFSARMVGVPGLHTVGACGGKIVALASPTDMPRPYNWARVLRHEFVHLLNLEQTAFNVPHWVTEGLAVSEEKRPRPASWIRLLTRRYKDDALFTLDDINFGFIRPSNSDDWTVAYAQAELYIEYLTEEYGDLSVAKLLLGFAQGYSTPEAVERASGVSIKEFERGYRDYVAKQIESWGLLNSTASTDIERLAKQVENEPGNPRRLAELAAAHFAKDELPLARKYATQAARLAPREPMAAYVLASLALKADDRNTAENTALAAFDAKAPHEGLVLLLAELQLARKQNAIGEKLLLLGKKHFPTLDQWNIRLARLYAKAKNEAKLEPILIELAATQEDDIATPAKLTELALGRNDLPAAKHWAKETLRIDVRHGAAHAALAQAYAQQKKPGAALAEWEAAVQGNDPQPEWNLALARLLIQQGQKERAKTILESLIETSPNLPGLVEAAQELRP
jgi:predicted Zn-dependent protease